MKINEVKIQDFRCFYGEQRARLAPLTLLVGENSTGKTSFMAIIRALCEVAVADSLPDFKEEPYDLGSFSEIIHQRGAKSGPTDRFSAQICFDASSSTGQQIVSFGVTFSERNTAPNPVIRCIQNDEVFMQAEEFENGKFILSGNSKNGSWTKVRNIEYVPARNDASLVPMMYLSSLFDEKRVQNDNQNDDQKDAIHAIQELTSISPLNKAYVPFASAPVRSRPRRTYDPSRSARDPEGDYVPMYLAQLFRDEDRTGWNRIKEKLERFGKNSGLFDEITIRSLGNYGSEPFQLQVRKQGVRRKGPWRNLIDVGYGVSQVLPILIELLRQNAPSIFLLQQPEVHLHPSSQAALGSLFCDVTDSRQLVIETHSQYLVNRIRMDVRDGVSKIEPEDVSILYFEHQGLDVKIHSLRIDKEGNVLNAPPSYGKFYLDELKRS